MQNNDFLIVFSVIAAIFGVSGLFVALMFASYNEAKLDVAEQCDRRGEIILDGYVYECTRVGRK